MSVKSLRFKGLYEISLQHTFLGKNCGFYDEDCSNFLAKKRPLVRA